jgi:hypothetical protein
MKKIALIVLLLMAAAVAKPVPQLSIDFAFTPDEIYPGERTIGVFNIVNPQGARPVFGLDIVFWAPCNDDNYYDFYDVTDWAVDDPSWKDTRITFSGVLDRREVFTTAGELFQYAQCLYSFVFQLPPKADNFKGPAVIRPGENISLNFTLQSGYARAGTYDMNIISQDYVLPGKELAAIIKK